MKVSEYFKPVPTDAEPVKTLPHYPVIREEENYWYARANLYIEIWGRDEVSEAMGRVGQLFNDVSWDILLKSIERQGELK